ncbi:MAG: glycosyltransferase family 4 protein [Promethearchaeota archaeon]
MKIILITDDFYPKLGGVAHTLLNLYENIQKTEHTLYIFNPYTKGKNIIKVINKQYFYFKDLKSFLKKRWFYFFTILSAYKLFRDKQNPISYRICNFMYLLTNPKILMRIIENIKKLYPYLRKMDFDLLFSANSGWIFTLAFILSRMFNKQIITLAHGNDFLIRNPLTLKTYYFKSVEKIIVSNVLMKKLIKKVHHLNESKLEIVYRGISLENSDVKNNKEILRKEFNIPREDFVILSVGRHNARKKFDLVIKAINIIKETKSFINLKYYLIGEGKETPKLKKLTKELKLENQVEFLGPCDNNKRNKFYKLSDLFIMPSISAKNNIEGFGIVFLEANYFKLPVIGTLSGGIAEAINNGETGLLVKPNDLNDLVEKILYLYGDKELRKKNGRKGT